MENMTTATKQGEVVQVEYESMQSVRYVATPCGSRHVLLYVCIRGT